MQISEIIIKLRKDQGLSQEELAQKLFVTRQAVSKWECDKAFPESDILLRIASEFKIPLCTLMGAPEQRICQSCGMPMNMPDVTDNVISPNHADYCRYCYGSDGYAREMTMEDMIQGMIDTGSLPSEIFPDDAATRRFLNALLPELERWRV